MRDQLVESRALNPEQPLGQPRETCLSFVKEQLELSFHKIKGADTNAQNICSALGLNYSISCGYGKIVSWSPLNFDGARNKDGQGIGFVVRDCTGKPFSTGYNGLYRGSFSNHLYILFIKFTMVQFFIEGDRPSHLTDSLEKIAETGVLTLSLSVIKNITALPHNSQFCSYKLKHLIGLQMLELGISS